MFAVVLLATPVGFKLSTGFQPGKASTIRRSEEAPRPGGHHVDAQPVHESRLSPDFDPIAAVLRKIVEMATRNSPLLLRNTREQSPLLLSSQLRATLQRIQNIECNASHELANRVAASRFRLLAVHAVCAIQLLLKIQPGAIT